MAQRVGRANRVNASPINTRMVVHWAHTGVETACAMDAQSRNFLAGRASGTESSYGDRGRNHACKLLKILTVRAPTVDGHTPVKRRDHEVGCRLAINGR